METINDGRIMEFVRELPPGSKTKVLLTSRRRTSEWEYPVQVIEFDENEVRDFVLAKSSQMNLEFPITDVSIKKIGEMSGGLPLAIQWTLGEYAKTKDLNTILARAVASDSPLLEFSFRNSWKVLDESAQQALSVLSIFEDPPTAQEWRTALDWTVERLDRAIASLIEATFITERTEQKTGKVVYSALPITLTFARNELAKMGSLEAQSRQRYQGYRNLMELATVETRQYSDLFDQFDAQTDTQKKAFILCRMAEGQARSLGYDAANQYFKQALDVEPRSVYSLVSYGLFKAELGNYGEAIELINKASQYCTKKTGYYVYFSLAKVYDQTRDRANKIKFLRKALEYEPKHTIGRHSLGVALSQSGNFGDALQVFDEIINEELHRPNGPSESLVYAYRTKIITLKHAHRETEASVILESAIKEIQKHRHIQYLIKRFDDLVDE